MLIVVRHGRTATNREGRLLGRADPELDTVGEAQAAALGAAIGSVDHIVSSPLSRTRATAAAIAGDRDIEVDDRWIELDYGDFEGRRLAEVDPATWARWRSDPDFAPPRGESLADLGRRVGAACADLAERAIDADVVVVTHVSPIKAALAWALGVGDEIAWRSFVQPASITRIACSPGDGAPRPSLHGFNDVAHLAGIVHEA